MSETHGTFSTPQYLTLRQLSEQFTWPIGGLKYWLFHRERNGLAKCVVKIGRKVLIDRIAFEGWIASHNTAADRISNQR